MPMAGAWLLLCRVLGSGFDSETLPRTPSRIHQIEGVEGIEAVPSSISFFKIRLAHSAHELTVTCWADFLQLRTDCSCLSEGKADPISPDCHELLRPEGK